ncbi:hypothetical protein B4Q13_16785, partial [Lacticaseibacillus rhamnosus]
MSGSPDERQELYLYGTAYEAAKLIFVVLGTLIARLALIRELEGIEVAVPQVLKTAAVERIGAASGGDDNFAAGGGAVLRLIARGKHAHLTDHIRG